MGDVMQFAAKQITKSKQVRPATSGNKNTNAKRGSVGAPVSGMAKTAIKATLKGPGI